MRKKTFFLVFVLLICITPHAWGAVSVTAPSGQLLYILPSTNGTAYIVHPGGLSNSYSWSGYQKPVGDLVIPDSIIYNGITYSVIGIANHAFCECDGLTSVTIPASVTEIMAYAFQYCSSLTSVTIGGDVTIGMWAFLSCTNLISVNSTNSIRGIGSYAFYNCPNLSSINISDADYIANDAFAFTSLTSVTINHASIGDGAFQYCTSLNSVTIGDDVTSIGNDAFYRCSGISTLSIGSGVSSIGDFAFSGCGLIDSLYINSDFFSMTTHLPGRTHVSVVIIGDSVTSIADNDFEGCTNLTSVIIGDGVTSIGNSAFKGCTNLTSALIGNGVTSIGIGAFEDCTYLTTVNIPDGVTVINQETFRSCYSLTSVIIGNNVTSIGHFAFQFCTQLTSINIPDAVTSIGICAFNQCSNLSTVILGNGVSKIYNDAFSSTRLTSITLPENVDSIGHDAFANCHYLDSVIMLPIIPPTLDYFSDYSVPFHDNSESRMFYVPCGTYDAYTSAWSMYANDIRTPSVDIDITVHSNNEAMGHVELLLSGGNTVNCEDSTAIIYAIPEHGFHFDHWSNGSVTNPDTIHLTGDSIVTAYFAVGNNSITTSVTDDGFNVYVHGNNIVVDKPDGNIVWVIDIYGRIIATKQCGYDAIHLNVPSTGIYFVRVGHHRTLKKVVVMK